MTAVHPGNWRFRSPPPGRWPGPRRSGSMPPMTVSIDGDRLLRDLRSLARIGAYKTGVHRPTYSPEDVQSRHWLAARMTEAGLDAEIDGIGNVIGRARGDDPHLL